MTREQLAKALNRSPRTIDRWHAERVGPPRTRCKKLILYKKSAVSEWLERRAEACG